MVTLLWCNACVMYKTYENKITNLIYFYVCYDINLMGTTYYINIKFSWDAMLCIAQRSKWQNSFNSIKTFWWKKVCILAFKNYSSPELNQILL